ncbi:unnamed protein product [Peronospora belbahrii]|uniref:RanBP2-type domain-containing protein n=1 Tax=Peronospora belbahrii TaxID=622444 RepID=A0AAU9LIJ8_9STRA|nr:unnamed protein product [Peronospora belbahrii]
MELATEHVRMLDAGRQRLGHSSPFASNCFDSMLSTKTQLLQHGNIYGLSFLGTENGFIMMTNQAFERSCNDYCKRRQEAFDHGQKLTFDEIDPVPVTKRVQLPSIVYWIALSSDELMLAVAYTDSVALFEVAHIIEAVNPAPFHTFSNLQAQEIAWCTDPESERLAILTLEKQVVVCTLDGVKSSINTQTDVSSISWSPSGKQIALGLVNSTIAIYDQESLQVVRSIGKPDCCEDASFEVHHVNWVEEELILAGYYKYDKESEETSALACIFESGKCVELDEIVGFFDIKNRRHQYFSAFLPDWRMFFIGCSLSADIELLVSDPEGGEWELWKPLEKYQARLPMNVEDEESFPMGLALNLNSTSPISLDEDACLSVPIVSCANTEGLLVNFAFVDTTVNEVEFVKSPLPFEKSVTRNAAVTEEFKTFETEATSESKPTSDTASPDTLVSPKQIVSHEYGQNDENEFAESDGESSDEEEERKEEEDRARTTFRSIASDGVGFIPSVQFPKLIKALGSTYSEEEHTSTLKSLEKDGKIYESDFVSWYVNWIFGDDDSESDDDADTHASSEAKPDEMKSKEEIVAAFSRFLAKEGSWKCGVCMVNNDPEATKCSACEALNPAAPKVVTPVTLASATSAGSIGFSTTPTSGFSFSSGSTAYETDCSKPSSLPMTMSHENGRNNEKYDIAASEEDENDEEEERKEEEANVRKVFRSIASKGADYISMEQVPKLFKVLGSTYSEEVHGSTFDSLKKNGKVYEVDFISWYRDWIFDDSDSEADEENGLLSLKQTVLHEYGQNDENEFAESDGESRDEEEERKEEEDRARTTFRSIASDGVGLIPSVQFPKLIKALGSTYSEEEHTSTLKSLEKDGKIYESDFVSWYVNWIFGDDDSESDDDADTHASSEAKPGEMKSKEEIVAAFSRFLAKEGSWKCGVCMVNNDPEATKCSACEALNPAAPKVVTPVTLASATSAGSIGSGGFSFPVSMKEASTASSFSFGTTPGAATVDGSKPGGFSFGSTTPTSGFSFSSGSTTSGTDFRVLTTAKPAAGLSFGSSSNSARAAGNGAYPPDTTSKPKPPAFGTTSGSEYPPDTTSKPKPPAFGTTSGSGYPPDTTSKPKPPAFGTTSGSGYPPDTTSKPKPPAFGTTSGSGYPPDTTSKPKPPAFVTTSGSGYPPDTTSKPKPPAFGTTSGSGYPPDTTSKPKPPAFVTTSGSGYPPDTTPKPKPPAFGPSTIPDKATSVSSFAFNKNQFGSHTGMSASINSSVQGNTLSTVTSTKTQSMFGNAFGNGRAMDTSSSPFGVVPKSTSKSVFSFGSTRSSDLNNVTRKANAVRPDFSFDTSALTTGTGEERDSVEDQPSTKRTLNFGDLNAFEAETSPISTAKMKAMPVVVPSESSKSIPSSQMEGQLWKLIIDFNKSLQRVKQRSTNILSRDPTFSTNFLAKVDKLRTQISNLCDEVNNLDELRDKIENDVLFVIGSDGDVHEQLEYGREILNSFNDEALKSTLEAQPLDQRSKETWESLKRILHEVEQCCLELDSHLSSFKIGAGGTGSVTSAHLFRVLKQTYDNSKMQYNKVCKLAEHLESLSLRGDRMRQANGVGRDTASETESRPQATKAAMIEMIVETEQRSQDVRRNFLSLCNNVVTPRDVFSTPRRKLAPATPSNSSTSPLQVKACSKLMPKMHLSVASPISSAKLSSRSVSFKNTPIKSGTKLFSLAEAMAPKEEPAKFVQTPQPAKPSVGVGKAPQRPSLGTPTTELKPALTTSSAAEKSNVFSFSNAAEGTESSFVPAFGKTGDTKTASTISSFSDFGVNSSAVTPRLKANVRPSSAFSLGGKEAPSSSSFSVGSMDAKSTGQPLSTDSVKPDYKALLETFYKVHNPSNADAGVIEKALTAYKGREEDLFAQLFSTYVPHSTPDAVKKYINGGPVPPKSESVAAGSKSSAPVAAAKSPFGDSATAQLSPFGASSSAFGLGPTASKSINFGGFGSTTTISSSTPSTTTTPFGKSAVDYRQKLVEFYQKHNPGKLSSVDSTLQKYKGNEEKLFQNLAAKYKVNDAHGGVTVPPASPAVQPATPNAAASPFARLVSVQQSLSQQHLRLAQLRPPASSPFGAASQTSSGFSSAGRSGFGSGFQSTSVTTPAFGAPSSFGATASGFGASGGVNYREKLIAFYQQHNPAKLSSVDATLEKYRGREDQLFAMLEQKYVKKTLTAPTPGGFGIPSTSTFGGGSSGFGAPSGLGVANAASTFGSASTLGGTAQPSFGGGAAGSSFGMASRMGGGFGSTAPASSSGGTAGSGFSAFGSQPVTFGGAPQQSGSFGAAAANTGSFGSSFGSNATTSSFGKPSAFNSSSFTQMR